MLGQISNGNWLRSGCKVYCIRPGMNTDEYLKLAEVEDRMWYFRSLHAHIARELEPVVPVGAAVLDAGCGTGGLILRLRARHPDWQYAGIDFMPIAAELAQKRCGAGVDIRVASITALPFPDASFDAVVSADVICQVENPEVACAEFFRVLRPGGVVVINVPAYMWMWSYHDDSCQTSTATRDLRSTPCCAMRSSSGGGRRIGTRCRFRWCGRSVSCSAPAATRAT